MPRNKDIRYDINQYPNPRTSGDPQPTMLSRGDYWQVENSLEDCYPLPDFTANLPIPMFPPETELPGSPSKAHEVPTEWYGLWLSLIARDMSLKRFLRVGSTSDMMRFYQALEKAHVAVHSLIERAAKDPGMVVVGHYLNLAIWHTGVESLMQPLQKELLKRGVDGV